MQTEIVQPFPNLATRRQINTNFHRVSLNLISLLSCYHISWSVICRLLLTQKSKSESLIETRAASFRVLRLVEKLLWAAPEFRPIGPLFDKAELAPTMWLPPPPPRVGCGLGPAPRGLFLSDGKAKSGSWGISGSSKTLVFRYCCLWMYLSNNWLFLVSLMDLGGSEVPPIMP